MHCKGAHFLFQWGSRNISKWKQWQGSDSRTKQHSSSTSELDACENDLEQLTT